LKAIFSLPVEKDGSLISYEDVVKGLSEDTLEYDASLGTSSGFRELAVFTLKAKVGSFPRLHVHQSLISSSFSITRPPTMKRLWNGSKISCGTPNSLPKGKKGQEKGQAVTDGSRFEM
jgi:hypothetical protein